MDFQTKKRLGQYFSGFKVAEMLASLCKLSGDETVIDPMMGIGDMLKAAIQFGIQPANVYGIEIDADAANGCNEIIPRDRVFVGDAFSLAAYEHFGKNSWDVVITNPPYVRYQTMSNNTNDRTIIKNAAEIRSSLGRIIDMLCHLTAEEKACFHRIINNYSGLSDLAVPSWLLCAALVKHGGVLAMVVPESWMSRDYAIAIKYLLLKFFDINYIVEDVNAAWFPEALVKTNLLVAQRTALRDDFLSEEMKTYKHIKLSAKLAGESSLVDGLHYCGKNGIKAFHSFLADDITRDGIESKNILMSDFVSSMSTSSAFGRLMKKLEPSIQNIGIGSVSIPNVVRETLQCEVFPLGIVSLTDWGFHIGQGLRTGANKFFYTEFLGSEADGVDLLHVDSLLGSNILAVARKNTLPALRYQSDVGEKYAATRDMLSHRLLYIQENLFNDEGNLKSAEDAPLVSHIAVSDAVAFESGGKLTRFRDLSAVKPNIRNVGQVRHWYMLPVLAKRHLPQLCVSRVNYKNTRCLLVDDGIVVDANFSTLWTEPRNNRTIYGFLALMNSSWVQACLESMATVMGGGALKVEASHLRGLPLPAPNEKLISSLYVLGKQLAQSDTDSSHDIIFQIDKTVLDEGLGFSNSVQHRERLRASVAAMIEVRKR